MATKEERDDRADRKPKNNLAQRCIWFTLIFFFFFVTGVLVFFNSRLPLPKSSKATPKHEFSAGWSLFLVYVPPSYGIHSKDRALNHLRHITSFGARTVGSYANEVKTPRFGFDEPAFCLPL